MSDFLDVLAAAGLVLLAIVVGAALGLGIARVAGWWP